MTLGITTGLIAAFFQSLAYLATRHFVQRRPAGASRQMLVLSHIWMGVLSFALLPFVWSDRGIAVVIAVAWPLFFACLFYLLGQLCLMIALKHAEPSRVSPLLGFKIVVLAAMATVIVQPHRPGQAPVPLGLTWLQWIAVILCILAAIALNFSGTQLRRRALAAIAIGCVWYSLSDWNIATLVTGVAANAPDVNPAMLAGALAYALSGVIAVFFLPTIDFRDRSAWRDSIPFAACWFVGMLLLYTCFGLEGPILGNILQSTRGLISILMGSIFVYLGHFHIEPLSGKGVFIRRLAAGILMFLAVSLYVIRDPAAWANPLPTSTLPAK